MLVMQTVKTPEATKFSLKVPLLSKGRTMDLLAMTETFRADIKVYAEGGENTLHTHAEEDHLFLVLQGQATFHLNLPEEVVIVNRHEGVLVPKGAYYWFQSTGDENLVLFRVGNKPSGYVRRDDDRVGVDGRPLPGHSAENKHVEPIFAPGEYFS
jgi:mannose-6-phosphate isomerase-like protein (cupin superfamily)